MSTNHDVPSSRQTRGDPFSWAREGAASQPTPAASRERVVTSDPSGGQLTRPDRNDEESPRDLQRTRTGHIQVPQAQSDVDGRAAVRDRPSEPDRPAGATPVPTAAHCAVATPPRPRDEQAAQRLNHPLEAGTILRARPPRPRHGWRAAVYTLTGGLIAPRLSPADVRRADQIRRVRTPLPEPRTLTVASMKGGVGKTTVSAVLGLTLAEYRGDRTIVIDANPDAGTLADRLVGDGLGPTIRELITDLPRITASTELARYTRLAGRLHVLPSEQDPAISEQFDMDEYEAVVGLLERFYDILITDSGTGVAHSAMSGALEHSDQLIVVGAPTVDAASRAAKTLDWLIEHDFGDLVGDAVVALSLDRQSPDVDRGQIHDYFAQRCRAVVELPHDEHLLTGGLIDLAQMSRSTADAALELTAHVADGFHHRAARIHPGQHR